MIPVPKKIEIVNVHDVARYITEFPITTEQKALEHDPTRIEVVIDGIVAATFKNGWDRSALYRAVSFIDGIAFAYKHYHSVSNLPTYTIQSKVIWATK